MMVELMYVNGIQSVPPPPWAARWPGMTMRATSKVVPSGLA